MSNMEFSIPYNNDPETLTDIIGWKDRTGNRIREIYLSGPQEYGGSGRIAPALGFHEFTEVLNRIHQEGIRVNVLLNSICEGSEWYSAEILKSTMSYLTRLHEEYGVEAVTIANPLYIREVRKLFPSIEICASVLGDVDCVQKAVIFKKAGADVITPDVNINRNLTLLKKIKDATNAELKLMVNEGCLYKCAFRKFHFNYISHKSKHPDSAHSIKGEDNVFSLNCIQLSKKDPSQILKSGWIRPEDTGKYREITNYFKIVGRTSSKSMIARSIEAYLGESYDGDLLELMAGNLYSLGMSYFIHLDNKSLDKIGFFEKAVSCGQECSDCSYCDEIIVKLTKRGVLSPAKIKDLGLK
jgi:collagenase-like PrtC family protease